MGSMSDYAENKILEHLVGKTSWTKPTAYLALSTADPGDSGSGLTEPSGFAYARKATAGSDWEAATGGSITNATELDFPAASGGSWGTITHLALMDNSTGGNMLASTALNSPQPIPNGNQAKFGPGTIILTLD